MRISQLFESLVKRNTNPPISVDSAVHEFESSENISALIELLRAEGYEIRNLSDRYITYAEMEKDSLIGSALELIADDVCQEDSISGHVVWVSSDSLEHEIVDELNAYIKELDIEDKVWSWVYFILRDGGIFLRTHYSDRTIGRKKYLEEIKDYLSVMELMKYGRTIGFCNKDDNGYILYSPMEYVHILSDRGILRERIKIKNSEDDEVEYVVRRGTSYLEKVMEAYKMVSLLENILVTVRFGRSALYRLFKIDVTGAGKVETAKILNDFKRSLSEINSISMTKQEFSANKKPIPYGKNIFIPVRGEKGNVSQELVGGDFDIKELVDLDYFQDKLFAALRIPKAYLGQEEAMPGGIGNQTLTRIDIRYARTVMRYQTLIKRGIKEILDKWCIFSGHKDWCDKFEVEMCHITTANESDKREELKNNIDLCDSIKSLLSDYEIDSEKLAKFLILKILGEDTLYRELFEPEEAEEQDNDEDNESSEDTEDYGYDEDEESYDESSEESGDEGSEESSEESSEENNSEEAEGNSEESEQ